MNFVEFLHLEMRNVNLTPFRQYGAVCNYVLTVVHQIERWTVVVNLPNSPSSDLRCQSCVDEGDLVGSQGMLTGFANNTKLQTGPLIMA